MRLDLDALGSHVLDSNLLDSNLLGGLFLTGRNRNAVFLYSGKSSLAAASAYSGMCR